MTSGRAPETKALGLDKLGVQLYKETGKIVVGADESTSVPNIYAFGDIGEVGIINTTLMAETALIAVIDGKTLHIIISLSLGCKKQHCAKVAVNVLL